MRNFKKCLIQMFMQQVGAAVFLCSSTQLNQREWQHACLHAKQVPQPDCWLQKRKEKGRWSLYRSRLSHSL